MKYLIVGASGFVGSQLLRYLKTTGHEVYGTGCRSKDPELIPFDLERDRIGCRLPVPMKNDPGASRAIVCTMASTMDDHARRRAAMREVHVTHTIRLIDDLRELGVRTVYFSSSYVFDGLKGNYTEEDAPAPICEYGRHKLEVETHLCRHHRDALILRLDKIVTTGDSPRNVLAEWLRKIRNGETIRCIDGQLLAPTLASDVAAAVQDGCAMGLAGVFHCCNPEFFSREELVLQLARAAGRRPKLVSLPMEHFGFADPRPLKTYLNSSRFIKITGTRFTPMSMVLGKLTGGFR